MKRKVKNTFIIFCLTILLFNNFCFASENVNFKSMIKNEEGSLFEKIIAETIGGIAQTVYNFATSDTLGVGFKNYDKLIFNSNAENDSLSPFTIDTWNKILDWYKIFSIIAGSLIFIAVVILSYKLMYAGINTSRKNEVKESLMRLLFGAVAISICPLFIRFLLLINNSLVHILLSSTNGGLDGLLGNEMLSSITTGNAITTAIVISMFIYLFVKLNIKFIVREFTLIVFIIFTPIVSGLWIINKNVTAAAIWSGQILVNIFMQFIYSFLFLLYLSFLPASTGWATSLIWAMMILPLADTLQNCLNNLTSRIAGIDNNDIANRALRMGGAFGFSMLALKNQFPTINGQSSDISSNIVSQSNPLTGVFNKIKNNFNPKMNLSSETDYNGNINPIRDVIPNEKIENSSSIQSNTFSGRNEDNKFASNNKSTISKAMSIAGKVTSSYLSVGAKLAEGDFSKSSYKQDNIKNKYNNLQSTAYHRDMSKQKEKENKDE